MLKLLVVLWGAGCGSPASFSVQKGSPLGQVGRGGVWGRGAKKATFLSCRLRVLLVPSGRAPFGQP